MNSNIISKIKKCISQPQIIINILVIRIFNPFIKWVVKNNIIIKSKINNVQLSVGKGVNFNQKTIVLGEGKVEIGAYASFGYKIGGNFRGGVCELQARYCDSEILIGCGVTSNNNLLVVCARQIIIGEDTLIGEGVMIMDHDAHGISPESRRTSIGNVDPIDIGKNVWIGSRVIILPGTSIGNNSVVGAGSIVKGKFPANVIIGGNPARVIRVI